MKTKIEKIKEIENRFKPFIKSMSNREKLRLDHILFIHYIEYGYSRTSMSKLIATWCFTKQYLDNQTEGCLDLILRLYPSRFCGGFRKVTKEELEMKSVNLNSSIL